jgi:hypothetical protein
MDEPISGKFSWAPYVGYGALGSVIGNVLVLLLAGVYISMRFGTSFLRNLHYLRDSVTIVGTVPLVVSLVVGAMIGLAVGFVIYALTQKCGKQPNAGRRATIGFVSFFLIYSLVYVRRFTVFSVAFDIAYAALVGGLAGLMARSKDHSALSITAERA